VKHLAIRSFALLSMCLAAACSVTPTNKGGSRAERGNTANNPNGEPPGEEDPGEDGTETPGGGNDTDAGPGDGGGGGTTACTWIKGAHARTDRAHGWSDAASMTSAGLEHRVGEVVFTGHEVFTWGGYTMVPGADAVTVQGDGATYDPASNTWKKLPAAPLSARTRVKMVYGDNKVFLWGEQENLQDGAYFDLCSGEWHAMPKSPIYGRGLAVAVYATTTQEMIVWNGNRSSAAKEGPLGVIMDGAAYSWKTNTWRIISATPLTGVGYAGYWTGTKMAVYGGGGNHGGGSSGLSATYDPKTDTWTKMTAPITVRQAPMGTGAGSTAMWFGGYNVCHCDDPVLADPRDGATWDEKTGEWTKIARLEKEVFGGSLAFGDGLWWAGGKLHVYGVLTGGASGGAVYDATASTWTAMNPDMVEAIAHAVAMGDRDALLIGGSTLKIFTE
jgi:N-acetylneuraminic acid mutarotase